MYPTIPTEITPLESGACVLTIEGCSFEFETKDLLFPNGQCQPVDLSPFGVMFRDGQHIVFSFGEKIAFRASYEEVMNGIFHSGAYSHIIRRRNTRQQSAGGSMDTSERGIMHVAGQVRRGSDKYHIIEMSGKERFVSQFCSKNLIFRSWAAKILPDGRIFPERSGFYSLHIPGEGDFLINAEEFRETVLPEGERNFTRIFQMSGSSSRRE